MTHIITHCLHCDYKLSAESLSAGHCLHCLKPYTEIPAQNQIDELHKLRKALNKIYFCPADCGNSCMSIAGDALGYTGDRK